MKTKNTIISVILIILGIAGFYLVNSRKDSVKTDRSTTLWSNLRKDRLVELEISTYKDGVTLSYNVRRENGTWHIINPINIMAKQEGAITLANEFLSIRPSSILSNVSANDFESYGLTNPKIKIAGILKDNSTNYLLIGAQTSVSHQYYVADHLSTNIVYIINKDEIEPFIQGISGLINTYMITRPVEEVVFADFKNFEGTHFQFTNINQFWEQVIPTKNSELDWGFRRFLLTLKDLSFLPDSISFKPTSDTLQRLAINTNTSPKLLLQYKDGEIIEFYISSTKTANGYPIYSINQNLVAYSKPQIIEEIFNIKENDLKVNP